MKRHQWEFRFGCGSLEEAAAKKAAYHQERLAYWTAGREDAERDLRDKGIEIRHHQVTGGQQAQALLDPEKANWLATCESKVRDHTDELRQYQEWRGTFARQEAGTFLDLHHDDIVFFGLGE